MNPDDIAEEFSALMEAGAEASAPARSHCAYRGDWGAWLLDPRDRLLWEPCSGVTVLLDECDRSSEMLDWIFQVAGHDADGQLTAGLIGALRDILHPQANLCSWGEDKRLTKAAIRRLITRAADCPGNRAHGRIRTFDPNYQPVRRRPRTAD